VIDASRSKRVWVRFPPSFLIVTVEGIMFKKLISFFATKPVKPKKVIGFNTDEVENEDDKFEHVHETFSIWCASSSKGEGGEGHQIRFDEGARNKHIFVRRAEIKGWKFMESECEWYCPTCKETLGNHPKHLDKYGKIIRSGIRCACIDPIGCIYSHEDE